MLKKLGIAAAIASVITVGAAGVAYAGDYDGDHKDHKSKHKSHDDSDDDDDHDKGINCSSHESTEQHNKSLIGGNLNLKNITGFIGGVVEKPAVCPEIGNDNEFNF